MKMKGKSGLKRSAENESNGNNKKRKENVKNNFRTSKSELYKPPTVEELNQLRETEILFNSNLFRLQTEELVKEVSLKERRKREINSWLEKFEKFVNNLPDYDDLNLSDFNACTEQEKHVKIKGIVKQIAKNKPLTLKTDQNSPVKLLKPLSCQPIGLYPLNATIGPTNHVTLNVIMPKICFQTKDYLNARYLVKRSLYLSYIATHLKQSNLVSTVSYAYLNENHLHPILHITVSEIKKTVFEVCVSPEEHTFKEPRFSSDKSNLRWLYWSSIQEREQPVTAKELCATPWYNALIAFDVTLSARDAEARGALQGLAGARDALLLLAVWLRQRELHAVGPGVLLELLSRLARAGRLNRHMSSYQAVRNVWAHLAEASWDSEHDYMFLDVTPMLFQRVQQEARRALQLLDAADMQAFQELFITRTPFCVQHDAVINIYDTPALQDVYHSAPDTCKLDYLGWRQPLIVEQLTHALSTALTDRVVSLVARPEAPVVWDIEGSAPSDELFVSFGLRFDPSNMFRVVDKGPAAYDPLAPAFRDFWGDKAELRRFKDGSISEAVYWPAQHVRDKRNICKSIIEYVLKDKYKVEEYNIVYDQFDGILERGDSPVEEGNLTVVSEFDELARKLRDLKLPLSIASVQGLSPAFSHSDAFPPKPRNHCAAAAATYEWNATALLKDKAPLRKAPQYVAPVEGVIQMVQHSKWPGELGAMRALRSAFYLQMSEQLKQAGLVCSVGPDCLDVVHGGLVTRLDLYHPKELSLLSEAQASARELRCVVLPRLRGALAGLHARFPALGPAAALASRWVRAQLLQLPACVVELLCAAVFTSVGAGEVSLSQHAFLHFLALVARHSWATEPLVLDVTGEMSATQRDELDSAFRGRRDKFPPLCVFTPWDVKSRVSEAGPTGPQLQRLRLLAQQGLSFVEQRAHSRELFNAGALFKPNLAGYHVLIHLEPLLNARRHEALFTDSAIGEDGYDPSKPNKMPVVNFNPAELYLETLQEHYSEFAVFFHDIHGGNVIAVLWKPEILEKHDFKISEVGGMKLLQNEQKLQVNIDAIIEDFYILGKGIVKNIEVM